MSKWRSDQALGIVHFRSRKGCSVDLKMLSMQMEAWKVIFLGKHSCEIADLEHLQIQKSGDVKMPAVRKWETQISLGLCSQGTAIVLPANVGKMKDQDQNILEFINNCHIYMVGKRRRITFVQDSVKIVNGDIEGIVQQNDHSGYRTSKFSIPRHQFLFPFSTVETAGVTNDKIILRDESGSEVFSAAVPMILPRSDVESREIQDVEIVYVGQSMGRDKHRNAAERLVAHSTLQKILADTLLNDPDSDIMLILVEYEDARLNTLMNPRDQAQITGKADIDRIEKAFRVLADKRLQICVAEAGLISYFKPVYNANLKSGFPTTRQKFLKQAYDIEVETVIVEIDTEDLSFRIKGGEFGPGYHHIAKYDLYDPKKRRGFFSMKMSDDKIVDPMASGPTF